MPIFKAWNDQPREPLLANNESRECTSFWGVFQLVWWLLKVLYTISVINPVDSMNLSVPYTFYHLFYIARKCVLPGIRAVINTSDTA